MQRIVYISTARHILSSIEIDGILRTSRRNNQAVGVTGLLVTGGRRFLQTLEGAPDAVEQVFRRIERDPRHFAVVILSRTQIEQRSFGGWAMGHCGGGAGAAETAAARAVGDLLAPITDKTLRAYFEGFAEVHAAA